MQEVAVPDALPAVFISREQAEAAVAELQQEGDGEDDVGVALVEHGHYRVLDEETHEVLEGVSKGVAVGVPAGALSGLALLAFIVPGLGTITAGGLVLAASKGVFWGAVIGGWVGILTKVRWDTDDDRWVDIPLNSGDVLAVVKPKGHYDRVHEILEEHGALWFLDPAQPEHRLYAPPVIE